MRYPAGSTSFIFHAVHSAQKIIVDKVSAMFSREKGRYVPDAYLMSAR